MKIVEIEWTSIVSIDNFELNVQYEKLGYVYDNFILFELNCILYQ